LSTATYPVTGLTCGHCANAVTEELSAVAEVRDVTVDLVPHGVSSVTIISDSALATETIAAALDEAGETTRWPSR
jgi:copper chaperone